MSAVLKLLFRLLEVLRVAGGIHATCAARPGGDESRTSRGEPKRLRGVGVAFSI